MRPLLGVPGEDFTIDDVRGDFPGEIEIATLDLPVDATVHVPGSKSVTNRALILAALAEGTSIIQNPLFSDDSYWLMDALARLGFETYADQPENLIRITGQRGIIPKTNVEVHTGLAGTVARFLPPVLALGEGPYRLDGVPRMRERPIGDLVDAMRRLGARVEYAEQDGRLPILLPGGGISGGESEVSGSKSSQFLSGLLMAAPYARKPVTLVPDEALRRPYVRITLDVMCSFGVQVEEDEGSYVVDGGYYRAKDYEVEPDASAASYFMAAAAVTGGRVRIPGLGNGATQGDMRFTEVLREMGCEVEVSSDYVEVRGPDRIKGIKVDMSEFSDTMITLSAIAPFAEGPTHITNVEHTRHQETDRISAVVTELARMGVRVREERDGLYIIPGPVHPAAVRTYGDHRIAMAFAVTGLRAPGMRIQDPGCVAKTFPRYFEALESLRKSQ